MLVACVGMIRSGSTLQYNLARTLVERLDAGRAEGFLKPGETPDLERRLAEWAASDTIHVVKMHAVAPLTCVPSGSLKVCYVYRDVRDVAASAKRFWGARGTKLLAALDEALDTYHAAVKLGDVLVWRYEDLLDDMERPLRELAAYLELDASAAVLSSVADECSLDKARRVTEQVANEKGGRVRHLLRRLPLVGGAAYDAEHLLHADHISETEGRSGVWVEILDDAERETISSRYAGWLEQQGYIA